MMFQVHEFSLKQMRDLLSEQGYKPFTATQIFNWTYQQGVEDFDLMTDIAKPGRAWLKSRFSFSPLILEQRRISADKTEKYLFGLEDGSSIETVMIPERKRKTLCVSTQVGCKFKCAFCVSGIKGFKRNLSTAEIVSQITEANKLIAPQKITNIVFMGIGEPLDNFANLIKAIGIMREKKGLGLGKRRICISTMGMIPQIKKLTELDPGVKLSLSLHAADTETRLKIMPGSRKYPLKDLIKAVYDYSCKTRTTVTFEYIMIRGINSRISDARNLIDLVKKVKAKVNLIPYNPSPYFKFQPPEAQDLAEFTSVLRKAGVDFFLRKPRGQDISAACGQLRRDAQS